ncbi:hypothetical protein MKW98_023476, partial [Papaver atlanticum]
SGYAFARKGKLVYISQGFFIASKRFFFQVLQVGTVFQIIKLMNVSLLKKRVWDSLMRKNSWGCNYQRELTTPLKYSGMEDFLYWLNPWLKQQAPKEIAPAISNPCSRKLLH